MKYKQLREISAVMLVIDGPPISIFCDYLKIYGYEVVNANLGCDRFAKFIKDAERDGCIDWFIEHRYIEEVEEVFHVGQEFEYRFAEREGVVYLLSNVGGLIGLIQVKGRGKGVCWDEFMAVKSGIKITADEFDKITNHQSGSFKLIKE